MLSWFVMPMVLAGYREKGILRRFATTPARPATLLAAQLLMNLAVLTVALALILVVGAGWLDVSAPRNAGGLLAVLALGVPAVFGVGLLLAATLPNTRAANGITWAVFAPSAFLAGIYVPIQFLPDVVRTIGDLTPLAALRWALEDVWVGAQPRPTHLVVLAVTALGSWLTAVLSFRNG